MGLCFYAENLRTERMIKFVKNLYCTFAFLLLGANGASYVLAQASPQPSSNRMESEFKLAVPKGQEDALWEYLAGHYSTEGLHEIDTSLSSRTETEIFVDQYFDTPDGQLLKLNVGVRLRQRFLGDSLMKKLVQLKLPGNDSSGVLRQEIKFEIYENTKRGDRLAMHPFYRYIRPGDRDEVNRFLAQHNLKAQGLRPSIKMKQQRSRVYISEKGEALITLTLDRAASAYFPYPTFTELEMELNEIRYTEGDSSERRRMEQINEAFKQELLAAFPGLQQDQTPKYNKMQEIVGASIWAGIADKLSYMVLAGLALLALWFFIKTEARNGRPRLVKMEKMSTQKTEAKLDKPVSGQVNVHRS